MVYNDNSSLDKIIAPITDDLKTFNMEYKRAPPIEIVVEIIFIALNEYKLEIKKFIPI